MTTPDAAEASPSPDLDGLLCALVLTPATYSRNRFFELHRRPEVAAVRRRAMRLRALIRQLSSTPDAVVSVTPRDAGELELVVLVPSLDLRRTTRISELEHHLVRYVLARSRGEDCGASRDAVERALGQLARGFLPAG